MTPSNNKIILFGLLILLSVHRFYLNSNLISARSIVGKRKAQSGQVFTPFRIFRTDASSSKEEYLTDFEIEPEIPVEMPKELSMFLIVFQYLLFFNY